MFGNKKLSSGGLILAGLAAFAYYKYSKMSVEERESLLGDLKSQGQKIVDKYVPEQYKSMFSKDSANNSGTASANSHFGEGNAYSS